MKRYRDLIFDIGMHTGEDAAFYLKKGFRVVAVEGNPTLAAKGAETFAKAIESGQLVIESACVSNSPGKVEFFINSKVTEWSSSDPKLGARQFGANAVRVPTVTVADLFERHGVPYYMKIDIEGADALPILGLWESEARPVLVSYKASEFELVATLHAMGYRRFAVAQQRLVPLTRLPNPALEGAYVAHDFALGASGAFGWEVNANWGTFEDCAREYTAYRYLHRGIPGQKDDWADIHAYNMEEAKAFGLTTLPGWASALPAVAKLPGPASATTPPAAPVPAAGRPAQPDSAASGPAGAPDPDLPQIVFEDDVHFRLGETRFRIDLGWAGKRAPSSQEAFTIVKNTAFFDRYAELRKETPKNIFEVGFFEGGSSIFLHDFFRPDQLTCVDRRRDPIPPVEAFIDRKGLSDHFRLVYGFDQADQAGLAELVDTHHGGTLDMVVDDCSHQYVLTRKTFEVLFPRLKPGGIYVIEDYGWSNMPDYQAADHLWSGNPGLTNLLFELIMMLPSERRLVTEVTVTPEVAIVRRGARAVSGTIDVDQEYVARGKNLSLI